MESIEKRWEGFADKADEIWMNIDHDGKQYIIGERDLEWLKKHGYRTLRKIWELSDDLQKFLEEEHEIY